MTFNERYWPTLDEPGSWLKYQVNQIVRGAVHPNGCIDVLERKYLGDQYITLLKHPDFPYIGMEYSTDPLNNVPPTQLDSAALYEAEGPDGIGEVRNNLGPPLSQIPPILLLPRDKTLYKVIKGVSRICGGPDGPDDYPWECGVTHYGYGEWTDSVRTFLHEFQGDHFYNYVFAAGSAGQKRGLVSWWEGHKNADGSFRGGLEYYAIGCGRV